MLLALDYGEKRIGVAVTDESGRFPTALKYIPYKSGQIKFTSQKNYLKDDSLKTRLDAQKTSRIQSKLELKKVLNKILYLINCYYPQKIIIGLPMSMDKNTGELVVGKQAKVVKKFAKKLENFLKSQKIICEILLIEESMSSVQAKENLKKLGVKGKKMKENIDSESARILLEGYISSVKNLN